MKAEELIKRCKEGNEHAMNMPYSLYAPKFEIICRKYVNDPSDVQDLVHDTFVIIFSSLDSLKDEEKFEMWSSVIAKNLALQFVRNKKYPLALDGLGESIASETQSVENRLGYRELLALVEKLPDGYKQVFKLSVFEGMTHKEIGEILGIEPNSSSSQLYRARKFLQDLVTRYFAWISIVIAVLIPTKFGVLVQNVSQVTNNEQPSVDMVDGDQTIFSYVKHKSHSTVPTVSVDSISTDKEVLITDTIFEKQISGETEEQVSKDTVERPLKDIIEDAPINSTRPQQEQLITNTDVEVPVSTSVSRKLGLSVSVTGGTQNITSQKHLVPGSIISGESPFVEEEVRYNYHIPIGLSLAFNMQLSNRFGIETGLRYTYQRADVTVTGPNPSFRTLDWHFVGIPIKGLFVIHSTPRLKVYGQAGAIMDIPVSGESKIKWSVTGGMGLEYRLTPSVGLYLEPSMEYQLNNHLLNTNTPRFNLKVPLGLRLTW